MAPVPSCIQWACQAPCLPAPQCTPTPSHRTWPLPRRCHRLKVTLLQGLVARRPTLVTAQQAQQASPRRPKRRTNSSRGTSPGFSSNNTGGRGTLAFNAWINWSFGSPSLARKIFKYHLQLQDSHFKERPSYSLPSLTRDALCVKSVRRLEEPSWKTSTTYGPIYGSECIGTMIDAPSTRRDKNTAIDSRSVQETDMLFQARVGISLASQNNRGIIITDIGGRV